MPQDTETITPDIKPKKSLQERIEEIKDARDQHCDRDAAAVARGDTHRWHDYCR